MCMHSHLPIMDIGQFIQRSISDQISYLKCAEYVNINRFRTLQESAKSVKKCVCMHQNSYGSGCAVLRDVIIVMHTQTKVKNQKTSLSPTLRITISSFIYLAHHNIYYYYYEKKLQKLT
jgi:hypothetical protein